ncbi:MAG: beta-ketoacyl-[acyl-carrier-protein] synthase family protein [Deltaproteobacteria bacterium]|jgi:3-oxoacyl-[acyl-carrier-protein] synthase-1/3-oxoacyl-[acyl-carrier-protein] synthase II|nr:beta-ketoacyl-[acyl-carrier-protein] synthase family protein [Deltaproteobacteria bacterium]
MNARVSPVAVTGMGCISAAGVTLCENLATLEAGFRAPKPPVLFHTEKPFPVFMATIPSLEEFFPLPDAKELIPCSRTVQLAAHAAAEALADAGLDLVELPHLRMGVCIGTSVGTAIEIYDYYAAQRSGKTPPLDAVHQYLVSNPAIALAQLLRLRGPAQTVDNACSSGADAIGFGAQWIRDGSCDVVLCGGADALAQVIYYGFSSLQLQSPEVCMPFDKNRKGLNLGEGAGIVVLESAERATGRARRGFVHGYGTCTDAWHLTAPHPEARGLIAALDQAFAQAGCSERDIAFINAHGTATRTNDAAESKFFQARFPQTPFIATKGCTGHTLGAAGGVEAVFTLAHLNRGRLPASPGFCEEDPELHIAPVSSPTTVLGSIAMSQSLAFGGNNSVLLLGKGG